MDEEKLNAFAISLILSQNSDVVRCVESGKHGECMDVTKKYKDILSAVPFYPGVKISARACFQKRLWRWGGAGFSCAEFRRFLATVNLSEAPR